MNIRKLSIVSALLIGLIVETIARAQDKTGEGQKPATRESRIRIEGPATLLGSQDIEMALNSREVLDRAVRAIQLNSSRIRTPVRFSVDRESRNYDRIVLDGRLILDVDDAPEVDGDRLLNALVENLRKFLAEPVEAESNRVGVRRGIAAKRLAELTQQRDALRDAQAALIRETGAPLSPGELEKSMVLISEKRRELELTLVGQRARQEAISKTIAELTSRIQERSASDPVVTELQKVVEIRERIVEKMQARLNASIASLEDVDRAVEGAALARADLARARATAAVSAGGEQIARLNAELMQLSIEEAEVRARSELLARQHEELRGGSAMKSAVEYDRLASRLHQLENILSDAAEQVARFETQAGGLEAPSVTIIGK